MKVYAVFTKGSIRYSVVAKDKNTLTLTDPHTKKTFRLPRAKETLEKAGFKLVKVKS